MNIIVPEIRMKITKRPSVTCTMVDVELLRVLRLKYASRFWR
jgi:hypothetical protein